MTRVVRVVVGMVCAVGIVALGGTVGAQAPGPAWPLVPLPSSVTAADGGPFMVTPATTIAVPLGDSRLAWMGRQLAEVIGLGVADLPPAVVTTAPDRNVIELALGSSVGPEGYELTVAADRIRISAADAAGVFYGVQTLRQLLPAWIEHDAVRADPKRPVGVPALRIVDRPRFAWRGFMLDVARHFFTVDEVKRVIDAIARYKFNRLHLHLADDQGWRIEIKAWPNLTAKGALSEVGGGPGGFYTQAQFADLVAYAAERFVTIVPEIDMPGHTNAALTSYADLNCNGVAPPAYTGVEVGFSTLCVDKPLTYTFIDDVVREITALTPGPYFHIGGDEVKLLTPAQYIAFVERVQAIVQAHGKQMIGWDEIAPAALLPTTLVQHWRPDGAPTAAVAKGAKVVMSVANRVYLDMKYDETTAIGQDWAAKIPVREAYDWDPATVAAGVSEPALAGLEAAVWTETIATVGDLEFMMFPRLAAIAEVAWTPQASRRWDEFRVRLAAHGARWEALGINYHRAAGVSW